MNDDPAYVEYRAACHKYCDMIFEAKSALDSGDVEKWNALFSEAVKAQEAALIEYNLARRAGK